MPAADLTPRSSPGDTPLERSPWRQVNIHCADQTAAERMGVAVLGPVLYRAETAGLVTSWFFVRKGQWWRVRLRPTPSAGQEAQAHLTTALTSGQTGGQLFRWVETIYEPEIHAFGGAEGMDTAHALFHADSRHMLDYLASDRASAPGRGDQRRELSILLCSAFLRAAGLDWYEQGDVWARVAEHRPSEQELPQHRIRTLAPALRRLMTVEAGSASPLVDGGPLTFAAGWVAAFERAGARYRSLAAEGRLNRGLRAVCAHHLLFHFNRLGLAYQVQAVLAAAGRELVFI
ncbi:MAG: methyltransferase [Dactylosporangium sp.]|nr:thiopeptide-type bacteriocin biosynthesis protein [Dactylosporangium sp.]NNJ61919.1 methyltransferase [Dactylosporangium sp.]